ncbi:MAG: sugar ABC transporter permease [Oscillospiraceae bacterium]|nr:sugar ABC transporter permease [Oscillospiraceae bacterium]
MKIAKTNNGLIALMFLLPSLIGFAVFSVLPMIVSMAVSLSSWDGLSKLILFDDVSGFFQEFGIGVANYSNIFATPELYQVLGNTLKFVAMYIPLMLIAAMSVGLILAKGRRGSGVLRILYYIPVITSWVAGALIWRWAFSPEYGIINEILKIFGISGPLWLQSAQWAMPGIVLASVWKDMGYFGLMLFAGLRSIDAGYYEAASIDGAGKIRQFFNVTLPMLSPTLFFVIIINIINSLQIFPQVMVMTPGGGPGGSTMVMVERIYTRAFSYYQMGYASALSWILFVVIFLFTFIQMQLQKRWVTYDV